MTERERQRYLIMCWFIPVKASMAGQGWASTCNSSWVSHTDAGSQALVPSSSDVLGMYGS